MGAELAAAVDFAEFLRNLVMPASVLSTFGLKIAHDLTGRVEEQGC